MTKSDCKYYNWNNNLDYSSYPSAYGARCEYYNEFFKMDGGLKPDCQTCQEYMIKKK